MKSNKDIIKSIFKWIARISSFLLFLFWGAFFTEHFYEWFLFHEKGLPPVFVRISMFFHLMMLFGLGLIIKWDKLGTMIMITGTIAFFSSTGFNKFPFISLLNAIPVAFLIIRWLLEYSDKRTAGKLD